MLQGKAQAVNTVLEFLNILVIEFFNSGENLPMCWQLHK